MSLTNVRLIRRAGRVLVVVAALAAATVVLALVLIQTPWFKERLRRLAVSQANRVLNGELAIGRLEGNLFTGVTLSDVVLRQDGRPSISIARVDARYDVTRVASGGVTLDALTLDRPVIRLRRMDDGWNLGRLLAPRPSSEPRGRPRLTFNRITLTGGQFLVESGIGNRESGVGSRGFAVERRIENINGALALRSGPDGLRIAVDPLSFTADQPDVAMQSFSGTITFAEGDVSLENVHVVTARSDLQVEGTIADYQSEARYNLNVEAASLALPELGGLLPAVRDMRLNPSFGADVDGPLDAMRINVRHLRSEAGQVEGDLVADFTGPNRRLGGELAVRDVDLASVFADPDRESAITGRVTFDLRFPSQSGEGFGDGTYRFQGPFARAFGYEARDLVTHGRLDGRRVTITSADGRAYGARVTARGTVDVPANGKPLALDLRGRARAVDVRRLPRTLDLPRLATSVDADYHVRGPEGAIGGELRFHAPSVVEGASIGAGSIAQFTFLPRRFDYSAKGTVSGLDLQRIGRAFDIEALAADRFESVIGGRFDVRGTVAPDTPAIVSGSGTLVRSTLMGGRLTDLAFTASMADNALDVTASGRFADYDLHTLFERDRLRGRVSGTADVQLWFPDVRAPLTPEYLDIAGLVTLEDSEVAGVAVQAMEAKGEYEKGAAAIDSLTASGPGYSLAAHGRAALDQQAPWAVTYRLLSDNLEPLAERAALPLGGTATVEGEVTGTREDLAVTGKLTAEKARYSTYLSAAALDSTFRLRLRELDVTRVEGDAEALARDVRAPGADVKTLTARAEYGVEGLGFQVQAEEARGRLEASGRASFRDGPPRVELQALSLEREGVTWRLAEGPARILVEEGAATSSRLELASLGQRLAAEGRVAIGEAASSDLRITAERIDLSQIDDLTTGDRGLAGLLDGEARLSGTRGAPRIDATVRVGDGAYGGVEIQSLAGTIGYADGLAEVDLHLQQHANARLEVQGIVPRTLFQPAPETPAGHVEPGPRDRLDLAIRAQQIDLALLREVVPQVTGLRGTTSADVRLTNAGRDPHVVGSAEITDAAFTLAAAGLRYHSGLASLRFEPERVIIERFQLLDPNDRPLAVTGQMAIHGGDVGQFAVTVKGTRFALVDNEYATVNADLDLRIDGELLQPRVEGDVEIRTAEVAVDRLLERLATGTYATESEYDMPDLPARPGQEITVTIPPPGGETTAAPAGRPSAPAAPARQEDEEEEEEEEQAADATAFAPSALNVRIRMPNNMLLHGQNLRRGTSGFSLGDINVTVGGDFRVAKAPREPVLLIGTVSTVRGQYTFHGRQFEIQRDGRITFRGGQPIDPGLDIRAERVIQGIRAQVHVHGTAREPELSVSSTPPLDEGDVLALIIFNQPASQLGNVQTQALAQSAGGLAAGFVVSPLAQSLGTALNIDLFEVQTTDDAGRISPSIVLGEQVGADLFVKFRQQFGAQQASEFLLEYQLADYLRWRSSVAEGEGVGRSVSRLLVQRIERYTMDLVFYFAY